MSPPNISDASDCNPSLILSLKVPIDEIVSTPKNRQIKKIQNLLKPPLKSLKANFIIDRLDKIVTGDFLLFFHSLI